MKICLIMGGNEDGGLESHFIDISNALGKQHSVHVIAHPKYAPLLKGVNVHPLNMVKSRRNLGLLVSIRKIIWKIRPDIIHAQANKAVSIIASIKLFLPKNICYIATLHNMKRNLNAYAKFDTVIGVSARIMEHMNHPNKKVIYNGIKVDSTRFKSRTYLLGQADIASEKVLLIALARLVPAKRMDVLLHAFKDIKGAHLLLVGDGPEKKPLEALAKKLNLVDITFLGQRADNVELLSAAEICVISSDREGFPYVLVETLLAKTTMISTDISDVSVILPKDTVVPLASPDELREVIQNAVNNFPVFYAEYKPTFKWAEKHLTFDFMLQEIEQVYNEAIY